MNADEDGDWTVWITGRETTSGAVDEDVLMVIYGDGGKSGELVLARGQLCEDQLTSQQCEVKIPGWMIVPSSLHII